MAGVAGVTELATTAKVLALLVPQALVAVTEMFPLTAVAVAETVTEVVPCPAVMFHPAGTIHV